MSLGSKVAQPIRAFTPDLQPDTITLVCDVDHTVLEEGGSTARLAARLRPLQEDHRLRLVLNSSRFVDSIAGSVRETELATPQWVIGGMGTQIHQWDTRANLAAPCAAGEKWAAHLGETFSAARIDHLIQDHAGGAAGFCMHDADSLSSLKRSFDWPAAEPAALSRLQAALDGAGQHAKVIYSSNLHCDVIPRAAGKGAAMEALIEHECWHRGDVIACGDSGNDQEMLESAPRAVVVGNAQPELLRLSSPHLYHAQGTAGDGVWEGLLHHFPKLR